MAGVGPAPILFNEFFQMFMRCMPPNGWPVNSKIAVGNSGGPDSTCLLFLLNMLLTDLRSKAMARQSIPTSVVSLSVNHNLQETSQLMAARSASNAEAMGVEHLTLDIPWGTPPFSAKPVAGQPVEQVAREARYHVVFNGMTHTGAHSVAFGHHADDQVETSLMRLARGTTELGAGGMRRCRRWGMGTGDVEGGLGWVGHHGLNRWIVRPLLEVRKDRILATCEEHQLDYVNDPTNFQPEITLRNAIRKMLTLQEEGKDMVIFISDAYPASLTITQSALSGLPQHIASSLDKIKVAAADLQDTPMDLTGGIHQLHGAVKVLSSRLEDVDNEVTFHLKNLTLPSPPSTLILSSHALPAVVDPTVRLAFVLRVMRYVSFHPWGSMRADGNRRRTSIQRIIDTLWQFDGAPPFTAGGGVLWQPAIFSAKKRLRVGTQCLGRQLQPGERFAWMASRLPAVPYHVLDTATLPPKLDVDVTERLATAINRGNPSLEVLFDCRFLVRFDLSQVPEELVDALRKYQETGVNVRIRPHTKFYWPKVVLRQPSCPDTIHATLLDDGQIGTFGRAPWVSMEYIRLLDAT
ncbi:PP-loop family-domain-containing protein [Suillus paluster]|uniref:PP-loop family-domain-containing protein n=1 Tax=Suillus paluster TaxID=48578 RepID=UPI001B87BF3D|nr:PP-loop family-domain-containing protein [Suillus paluster]KAG1756314.1 PP-loop family-domain-containing protein [Suillus paluster]